MAPGLALALCCSFVVFLLRLERQRIDGLSLALWVPTIWILYCASRPITMWLSSAGVTDFSVSVAEGNPIERTFLLTLILLGLGILAKRRPNWSRIIRENFWLFALFGLMLISILWSEYMFVSFKRWFKAGGSVIMAIVVLTERSPRLAIESILRRSVYILIPISVLLVKYYPYQGVRFGRWDGARMWIGVATQKNGLGRLCFVAILFLGWALYCRWRANGRRVIWSHESLCDLLLIGMSLYLIRGPGGGSYSATSLAVLALGIGCIWLQVRYHGSVQRVEWCAVGLLGTYLVVDLIVQSISGGNLMLLFLEFIGRDATLTGRTEIWNELSRIAWDEPILGLGYGAFWIDPDISFIVNQGHNGYLDVFLELGILGLIVLVAFLVSVYQKVRRVLQRDPDWGAFVFAFLMVSIAYNYTEGSFLKSTSHLWVLLIFLAVVVEAAAKKPGRRDVQSGEGSARTECRFCIEAA